MSATVFTSLTLSTVTECQVRVSSSNVALPASTGNGVAVPTVPVPDVVAAAQTVPRTLGFLPSSATRSESSLVHLVLVLAGVGIVLAQQPFSRFG